MSDCSLAVDPISLRAERLFSISYLYPVQRYAVSNILDGIDQIVVMPTGAGKSLCYQLPAGILPGFTLVVVPLLSLLRDQLRRLGELDLPCAALRGGQDAASRRRVMEDVARERVKLVFTTPEMLEGLGRDRFFRGLVLHHVVVDEAHCISEWGESFRPSYLRLGAFVERVKPPLVTAFTATASPRVLGRIVSLLYPERSPSVLQESPDRPNIRYAVRTVLSKARALRRLLGPDAEASVVFCLTRREAELYARVLRRRLAGREIFFYHAGLSRQERSRVESWFLDSRSGILTATSAYGMGVDKADIRRAVHMGIPRSVEAYLQESGRIGRDGLPAEALLLCSYQDLAPDTAPGSVEADRREMMRRYALSRRCRRSYLAELMGQGPPPCSGCDVCSGAAPVEVEGQREMLSAIRRNQRRFTSREALKHLCRLAGSPQADAGILSDWEAAEIEEALSALTAVGSIRSAPRGFWRGRLSVVKEPTPR